MKIISLLLLIFSISVTYHLYNGEEHKLEIIFVDPEVLFHAPLDEKDFWIEIKNPEFEESELGHIIIYGTVYRDFIKQKVDKFAPAKEGLEYIDHRIAFIFHHPINKDTLYTDFGFTNWKIKGKIFVDSSGYFDKTFSNFVIIAEK